jgi:hypothetical protein
MATYYIDYSATYDGDGSAPDQAAGAGQPGAFNTLVGHLGANGDTIWIRRVTPASANVAIDFNVDNVKYIGFPIEGDDYYSIRPSGAATLWDADSATYITITTSSTTTPNFKATGGALQEFHRIKTISTGNASPTWQCITYNCLFKNCYFEHTYGGNAAHYAITAQYGRFYSCIASEATVAPGASCWYIVPTSDVYLHSCSNVATGNNICGITFYNVNGVCNITCIDCTFYAKGIGAALANTTSQLSTGKKYFYNCDFYGSSTVGAFAISLNTGAFCYIIFDKCRILSGSGMILISGAINGICNFTEVTQTAANNSYAINIASTGFSLSIENFTTYLGNTTGDIVSHSPVYIRNGTFKHVNEVDITPNVWRDVTIMDYAGKKGFYKSYQNAGVITTDVTARTGGASYSIKMQPLFQATYNTSADIYNPDKLITTIGLPSKEIMFVSATAGTRTITVYGAYKMWVIAPTAKELWMEGSYYSSASDCTWAIFSTRDTAVTSPAALTTDTSIWTGDSSLTLFKLAITVTIGQDCLIPIRILLSKFQVGAYIYIDPTPIVS